MADALPELLLADAAALREWLGAHGDRSAGVWLVLARKGTTTPTSLAYEEAVDEAVCHGWIDGQIRRRDAATYSVRITPRRSGSAWSASNVARVERLRASGRMRAAGLAAVDAAKAAGRWP